MKSKDKNLLSQWIGLLMREPLRHARGYFRALLGLDLYYSRRYVRRYFRMLWYLAMAMHRRYSGNVPDFGNELVSHGIGVSLLLPSRGRVEMLKNTLQNIANTCENDPSKVEVLIRLDEDDDESLTARESFYAACSPVDLKIIVGPRGEGYRNFHVFVNELAAVARGDFLMLFNDDARFLSRNWPSAIQGWRNQLVVLRFNTCTSENIFPAAHRKIFEILGHYSLDTHSDSWIESVAGQLFMQRDEMSIEIDHIRGTEEARDQTYAETSAAYSITHPVFVKKKDLRKKDVLRLAGHIVKHGRSLNILKAKEIA